MPKASSEWWTGPLLGFDCETTGVDPTTDRLVTIALVEADATARTSAADHWVINAGVDIPTEASDIHGWTTERVQAEGLPPTDVLPLVAGRIEKHLSEGLPLVAYNASFDLTFLNVELARLGLRQLTDPRPVVDPFVIDKHVDRYRRGKRTLTASADHYKVDLDGAHDAAADAITAARLAWRLGQLPVIRDMGLDELHDAQVGWAAEQADSLRAYFLTSGKTDAARSVDGSWPHRIYHHVS